jgi:hypothetical protein
MRKGSQNLNRILRVTATLLFEKGEPLQNICKLLDGYAEPRLVRLWKMKWCQANGKFPERTISNARLPMPPIDWDSVTLDTLQSVADAAQRGIRSASAGDSE